MLMNLNSAIRRYPGQFWLMFLGMFLSTLGTSMIWPFLMIYVSKKLDAPMALAASLLSINSMIGVGTSFLGGPLLDRIGRKWIMVFSLAANGVAYIFLGTADVYVQFAILMGITGAVNPLYRSGADAMIADLVPSETRTDAYSLMRLSNNLGISIGPVIGGFVAASSYAIAFYCAAAGMISYGILLAFFAHETLPMNKKQFSAQPPVERFGGYPDILHDSRFMRFLFTFTLTQICAILMWTIMPVHANSNFGIPENVYRWIPATNAILVVSLQQLITQYTKRHQPLRMLSLGSLFYALAVGAVSLATNFWGFWLCIIVMTFGEMILVPISSTYAANLAPSEKRGRYMSLYGLTWPIGAGIGPFVGGLLNDTLGPNAIWYGGLIGGLVGVAIFASMERSISNYHTLSQPPASD